MRERWVELSRLAKFVLATTAVASFLLVIGALAYFFLPAIGTPSARALQYSLASEVGGDTDLGDVWKCKRRQGTLWVCDVGDSQGSGAATYRLRTEDRRCWQARKLTPDSQEEGPALERRSSACVKLHDQVRLLERFLY
jgi:hypothetical protein